MDGGSSINRLYQSSMEKLGILLAQLEPSRLIFHGIMLGYSCTPMGTVRLEVLFGKKGNSHREPIWFEVVDISSPYHASGDPGLPSGMPIMHTIHDPRNTVMNPHNRVGITEYIIHYINKSFSLTWPLGRI
jgi:hypothetical protein